MQVQRNTVLEIDFRSKAQCDNPQEVQITLDFTAPGGETFALPSFWKGGNAWAVRFAGEQLGRYRYVSRCSGIADAALSGLTGEIEVTPYTGDNPLYAHGRVQARGKRFAHQDGTPFFWLGDTWWMALCKRLRFPYELDELIADRTRKGFSVIQIIAGLYPDMPPFDERGANEAGYPWDEQYEKLNPAYFDHMDQRIQRIIDAGLTPCIVGCWGYFIDFANREALLRHWKNLIARYAAYPVVWCAAGEGTMPFYGYYGWSEEHNAHFVDISRGAGRQPYQDMAIAEWSAIIREMHALDAYHNIITIHPSDYAHKIVDDTSILDYNMLQTGHGGNGCLEATVNMIGEALAATPDMPVIDAEVCYEGIGGVCEAYAQRFAFWSTVMLGAAGFTYGANGLWQLNCEGAPYGLSPHGLSWGYTTWREAMALPGSKQLGQAKALLERYPWWKFETHMEWVVEPHERPNLQRIYAAGIPGETMLFFIPSNRAFGIDASLNCLAPGARYRAKFVDLVSFTELDGGTVCCEDGVWPIRCGNVSNLPIYSDMLLVLEKI